MSEKRARQNLSERTEQAFKDKTRDPVGYLLGHARRRAAKLGVPFDLCREDIVVPDRCPVFGFPLMWGRGKKGRANLYAPSIDRIRPLLGYVRGNVAVISSKANYLKNNATPEEMRLLLAYVESRGDWWLQIHQGRLVNATP
jgi:hypothetical protein